MKNYDVFLIFAQNINFGYTLEPPHYIKVGCKGVFITLTCFHDVRILDENKETLQIRSLIYVFVSGLD